MFKSFFRLTLSGIRNRQMRSWLTIIGVVISITLVVIIISLNSGLQRTVNSQLQRFGGNLIFVFPGKETNPLLSLVGGQKFNKEDLLDLKNIEGVEMVVPTNVAGMNVEYKGENKSVLIHGAPWVGIKTIFEDSRGLTLFGDTWPQAGNTNEIVLGYTIATGLFKNKVQVGDEITITSKKIKVVGYLSESGNFKDDNSIYLAEEAFEQLSGIKNKASLAMITVNPQASMNLIEKEINFQLSGQSEVTDFTILTPAKAESLVGGTLNIIEIGLLIIALVSLLVGAVGIMNTMYTSVLERTKQIGIMKAIGASSEAILSLFLLESGIIGLIGGFFGIIFGILSAYFIGHLAVYAGISGLFSFSDIDYYGLGVILIITTIVGVLSGVLPARSAARLEPAEALRYE